MRWRSVANDEQRNEDCPNGRGQQNEVVTLRRLRRITTIDYYHYYYLFRWELIQVSGKKIPIREMRVTHNRHVLGENPAEKIGDVECQEAGDRNEEFVV